ncbi:MAG: hypothetical protein QOC55_957 [Thermoleophilaceae bacterium]|jgi:hypothetical protein|nr:hypothetical protein [Thermoleophilaceae bacterium]
MAFIVTRIHVGDYDRWRPLFDQDQPKAREQATTQRVLRSADDPNEVVILLEFDSLDDAHESRERLQKAGVLDRFDDKTGPLVLEIAE